MSEALPLSGIANKLRQAIATQPVSYHELAGKLRRARTGIAELSVCATDLLYPLPGDEVYARVVIVALADMESTPDFATYDDIAGAINQVFGETYEQLGKRFPIEPFIAQVWATLESLTAETG